MERDWEREGSEGLRDCVGEWVLMQERGRDRDVMHY